MSGALGTGVNDHNHDLRRPPEQLAETHPAVDVFDLARRGLLGPGVTETVAGGSRLATDNAGNLTIDGQPIRLVYHKSLPLRAFQCPKCGADRYRLYRVNGEWRCRFDPPALDYSSRHRNRSVPGLARLAWLRKRINASPVPFSPITPRRRNALRFWRAVMEIRRLEAGLAQHGAEIAAVLERRHARRYGREGS